MSKTAHNTLFVSHLNLIHRGADQMADNDQIQRTR